jgi:hypothetical protein
MKTYKARVDHNVQLPPGSLHYFLSFSLCGTDDMSALNQNIPDNIEAKDLECLGRSPSQTASVRDTTTDAVFGEITEDGPNYRGVSVSNSRRASSHKNLMSCSS